MEDYTSLRQEALAAHQKGDYKRAETIYSKLIASNANIDDIINLGALFRSTGQFQKAHSHYQKWLSIFNKSFIFRMNAANFFCEMQLVEEVEATIKPFVDNPKFNNNLDIAKYQGKILIYKRKPSEALKVFEMIAEAKPRCVDNWMDIGVCYSLLNKNDDALKAYEHAQQIDKNDLRITGNRITLLRLTGDIIKARGLINSLTKEERESDSIATAEAAILHVEKNYLLAAKLNIQLCNKKQINWIHWRNLAADLRALRQPYASHKIIQKGLLIAPNNSDLLQALAHSLAERGQHKKSKQIILDSIKNRTIENSCIMFHLQCTCSGYHLLEPVQLNEIAKKWEANSRRASKCMPNSKKKNKIFDIIKIAYFSSDLCNHPVGRFMRSIIKNHNKKIFKAYIIDTGSKYDEINEQIKKESFHWINLKGQTSEQIDKHIRSLGLDILVELGGYTNLSRIDGLISKPVPIQLSYLGYPAPTYLEAIDGWIGDEIIFGSLDPVNRSAHNLYKLNGGYMAYDSIKDFPAISTRENKPRRFRFGSFNHNRKLTSQTIKLWVNIMNLTPSSELMIKSVSLSEKKEQERVRTQFRDHGLDTKRLIIVPEVTTQEKHLKMYSDIDVALDPIPYGGATTTCDAIMMGVPVISLAGPEMIGRLSSSILYYCGLGKWIASNDQEYINIAIYAYLNGKRSNADREELRKIVCNSPFADGKRLTNELETLYKNLVENY
ncbi:hypothetical protein [Synechococcus sp. KORDI-100]|uniref:tetratricopeptide repeat protein n=1 Tax=Synechococcus sp. KORDI-100 TaxID=1280380 RepID=UPI00138E5558|nr:hypothetical protein [Synechococcus sp. KORDI-100]